MACTSGCQLLLAKLGQRMQTAAEQRSHLLGGHRVAGGQAVDPGQAGTDPHPGDSPRSVPKYDAWTVRDAALCTTPGVRLRQNRVPDR
jgi:hypothetical protein